MEDLLFYEGFRLVFEDDFDGTELDRSRWNVELHQPGWVNEELQEYVDSRENISVRDGKLLIRPINFQVHYRGGLLVGHRGVRGAGGGPLHRGPGRERPDRRPDVAKSEPGK